MGSVGMPYEPLQPAQLRLPQHCSSSGGRHPRASNGEYGWAPLKHCTSRCLSHAGFDVCTTSNLGRLIDCIDQYTRGVEQEAPAAAWTALHQRRYASHGNLIRSTARALIRIFANFARPTAASRLPCSLTGHEEAAKIKISVRIVNLMLHPDPWTRTAASAAAHARTEGPRLRARCNPL